MVSIEILRQMRFFQNLDPAQLSSVAQSVELRHIAKNAYLFRAGERAEALYILVSGALAVSRDDAQGRRILLARIKPGTCLGEMGLSQGAPRSADVFAHSDAVLLQIQRLQFEQLMREQPAFARNLLADLSRKLEEANRRLESTVGLSVKERLWLTLRDMAKSGCIRPAPKVTQLAAQIDASREMTSKALSQLIRENCVQKESTGIWRIQEIPRTAA